MQVLWEIHEDDDVDDNVTHKVWAPVLQAITQCYSAGLCQPSAACPHSNTTSTLAQSRSKVYILQWWGARLQNDVGNNSMEATLRFASACFPICSLQRMGGHLCRRTIGLVLCRYDAHDSFEEEEATVHFMSSGKPLLWHVFLWAGLHSVCHTRDIQQCMIRHTGLMALCPGKT